jgi:hypothetical protein
LAGKDELIILSDQGENCLGLTKFRPPSSHLDCCIAFADKVLLRQFRQRDNTSTETYPVSNLLFDSHEKDGAKRNVATLGRWPLFPPAEVIGSLNHKEKVSSGGMKNKSNEILTSPCHCSSKPSVSTAGRRREVPAALGEGIWPRELHPPHLKTSNVSIRRNNAKMNMILTFPSLLQLLTINIDQGEEEWGVPRSSGRRDPPRSSRRHPVKHHEVSFR